MSTTIYLIRHGEVYNPNGTLYGRLPNFALSEKGKREVKQTAEFLKNKNIFQIHASPLLRTKQTAEIINNALHLPNIIFSPEIIEVKTSYEGKKFSDLDLYQAYLKPLKTNDETIIQIAQRMKKFLEEMIETHIDKKIIIVSHGDPIMILKTVIQKKELSLTNIFETDAYIHHGEVYKITVDGKNNLSIKSVFIPQI